MNGKKSFILYCDLISVIEKLPDEKAGKLFKTILKYVNDQNPVIEDLLLQVAFEPIKLQLKRDLIHWREVTEKRQVAGKLGGRPKKQMKAKKANGFLDEQTKAKKPVTVTVTDIVTVTENGTDTVPNSNSNTISSGTEVPGSAFSENPNSDPKVETPRLAGNPPKPPKKPTEPVAEKEASKSNLHIPMKEIFLKYYFKKKQVEYFWTGRDGKAMNQLIKKMHHVAPGTSDDGMLNGWEMFLKKIGDKWILDHLELSIINSKFNELFAAAKGPASAEELLSEYRKEQRACRNA